MAIDFDSMTPQQWADWNMKTMAACLDGPKPNKYRSRKTEYRGVLYDSKAEADYAAELDVMKLAGDIAWSLRQVWIPLGPDFRTRIDFLVAKRFMLTGYDNLFYHEGHEVKGKETNEFKKVRKLWPKYGPFPLFVVKNGKSELIEGKP